MTKRLADGVNTVVHGAAEQKLLFRIHSSSLIHKYTIHSFGDGIRGSTWIGQFRKH